MIQMLQENIHYMITGQWKNITIIWVPGHSEINGNKQANLTARKADTQEYIQSRQQQI